jgi:hypothetical protein
MRIIIYALLLCLLYARSPLAQTTKDLIRYETILDDFAEASVNNLNFQNGINVFIEKPESDLDALYQGFRITHTDGEYNGGWEILYAKDIVIQEEIPLNFRAVLYLFRNKQYIVLYKEESEGKYYFRLFNAVY